MSVPSGSPTLDELLDGGLALGDNIVWIVDHDDDIAALTTAFLSGSDGPRLHLCFASKGVCRHHPGDDVIHLGENDSLRPAAIERLVLAADIGSGARLVLERVDDLVLRWGASETVQFYRNTCPRLFDRGAIAYWMATPRPDQPWWRGSRVWPSACSRSGPDDSESSRQRGGPVASKE